MKGGFEMVTLYKCLVFIHVFSAILGIGPGFVLVSIAKSAKTMTELRHAYALKRRLHNYVMIGGTLLLVTGLSMGALNPALFHAGWYVTSLALFIVTLIMGPTVLVPDTKPIKALLAEYDGDDIPEEYHRLARRLYRHENILSLIFVIIISLMILKPF